MSSRISSSSKSSSQSKIMGKSLSTSPGMIIAVVLLVVLFFALIYWITSVPSGQSAFANIKSRFGMSGSAPNLKNLDLIMFMSPQCQWCKKTIDMLTREGQLNNLSIVDVTKPEGIAIAKQYGADKQKVPSFISRQLRTGAVGFQESVSKLVEVLKQPKQMPVQQPPGSSEEVGGGGLVNAITNLKIIMFAREDCGWCKKAKELYSQANVMDVIQVVDANSPEGREMMGNLLPPGSAGVPAFVSMVTKKTVIGFRPIDQLIQELQ